MLQRIISAVVAAAIVLPIIILGGMPFKVLIYLMASIALFELIRMKKMKVMSLPSMVSFIALWLLMYPSFQIQTHFSKMEILLLFVLIILTSTVLSKNKFTFENAGFLLLSVIYLGFGFFYFIEIREYGLIYIFLPLFVIWATDSGAYFIGRAIGKRKLWPEISPNKTIEGAVGGILCAMVVALGFKSFITIDVSLFEIMIISFLLAIFGQIGDLVESAFKRYYNVKDSGNIMPGHGGVLDRLDSLIFVFPILHLLLTIFI